MLRVGLPIGRHVRVRRVVRVDPNSKERAGRRGLVLKRDPRTAGHEASHIVVGVALGLQLKRAVVELVPGFEWSGGVWFDGRHGAIEAWGIMYAAGVAWERRKTGHVRGASGDLALLRSIHVRSRSALYALETAAWALVLDRAFIHSAVTEALISRDLNGKDIAALARGERITDDE